MKSYATNFDPRLVALTGTPDETTAAARAYRVYFAKAKSDREADYAVDHSSFIYLMGRDGRYLAHFGPDASAEQMAAAIKKYL
jgi:protein SCO1/2